MHAAAALTPREREVLACLLANCGRVIARHELARQAGLAELHDRRCDNVLVRLRERLGTDSIITVRSRGWMLSMAVVGHAIELLNVELCTNGAGN